MGGDTVDLLVLAVERVSIHASTWEATRRHRQTAGLSLFQSTPPHGRRRPEDGRVVEVVVVSIHASAWEATFELCHLSQHVCSFNPRLRMGGDPAHPSCGGGTSKVSIHASAWEATDHLKMFRVAREFQSTPPHGRRPELTESEDERIRFQSTPPHGRRHLRPHYHIDCTSSRSSGLLCPRLYSIGYGFQ